MKMSMKRWLALAMLGWAGAAAAQQEAPVSNEQQQAINNKIRRIPPIGLGDKRTPEQIAAALAKQRKTWEPTPPPSDPRDFTGTWAMNNGRLDLIQDDGQRAPFRAAEARSIIELIKAEEDGNVLTDASSQCFPHGTPRL